MEPNQLYAGATWTWDVTVADYSAADGWSLEYILTNASGAISFTDDGSATGTTYTINVAAATTASKTAGDYTWQLFAVNGTDRRFVSSGPLKVLADISGGGTPLDVRSDFQQILDALIATRKGTATKAQQSHSIAGRSIVRMDGAELDKAIARYSNLVAQEQAAAQVAAGRGNPNTIKAAFRRPT